MYQCTGKVIDKVKTIDQSNLTGKFIGKVNIIDQPNITGKVIDINEPNLTGKVTAKVKTFNYKLIKVERLHITFTLLKSYRRWDSKLPQDRKINLTSFV